MSGRPPSSGRRAKGLSTVRVGPPRPRAGPARGRRDQCKAVSSGQRGNEGPCLDTAEPPPESDLCPTWQDRADSVIAAHPDPLGSARDRRAARRAIRLAPEGGHRLPRVEGKDDRPVGAAPDLADDAARCIGDRHCVAPAVGSRPRDSSAAAVTRRAKRGDGPDERKQAPLACPDDSSGQWSARSRPATPGNSLPGRPVSSALPSATSRTGFGSSRRARRAQLLRTDPLLVVRAIFPQGVGGLPPSLDTRRWGSEARLPTTYDRSRGTSTHVRAGIARPLSRSGASPREDLLLPLGGGVRRVRWAQRPRAPTQSQRRGANLGRQRGLRRQRFTGCRFCPTLTSPGSRSRSGAVRASQEGACCPPRGRSVSARTCCSRATCTSPITVMHSTTFPGPSSARGSIVSTPVIVDDGAWLGEGRTSSSVRASGSAEAWSSAPTPVVLDDVPDFTPSPSALGAGVSPPGSRRRRPSRRRAEQNPVPGVPLSTTRRRRHAWDSKLRPLPTLFGPLVQRDHRVQAAAPIAGHRSMRRSRTTCPPARRCTRCRGPTRDGAVAGAGGASAGSDSTPPLAALVAPTCDRPRP